jgi:GT2 family glycosyltransferase
MPCKIGILVVTYNQLGKTRNWINDFYSKGFCTDFVRLLVLDNASNDNTYDILHKEFPNLDIRLLNANYGCTVGRNIGISELYEMGCDTYFGFDPDVIINDTLFFEKAIRFLEKRPDLDGFTPVLRFYEDMSIQGLGGRKGALGVMKTVTNISENRGVHYIPGGSSVIRMSTFRKYGIYDSDLPPIGGQDYEWGYRISKLGGKLEYNPELEVIHFHEKSARNTNLVQKRWIFVSRTVFLRKHFSHGHLLREVRHLYQSLGMFKPLYILSSYKEGLRKKLHADSYNFESFLKRDRSCFYQTNLQ